MQEIEIKILEISRRSVEARLKEMAARLVFDDEIDALLFDFPGGRIEAARNLLRLRREGKRAMLTFKGYLPDAVAKVRQEFETEVSDFETARTILECLGLSVVRRVTKHRTTYELPGVRFAFDRHSGDLVYIPEFLEIEGDDHEILERHVRLLGFDPADCRPWGLPELIAHYSQPGASE